MIESTSGPRLIVVMAHARSGSSLLMQTLRCFGAEIIGTEMRDDLPTEHNPRGYFEAPEILTAGMTGAAITRVESAQGHCVVVKLALRNMLKPNRSKQWEYLAAKQATVLLPVRHPLEMALSRLVFRPDRCATDRFIVTTQFLRNYRAYFRRLAEILLKEHPSLLPHVHVVSHAWAVKQPDKYVEQVAALAGMLPSVPQCDAALANIDPMLYRYRLDELADEQRSWDLKIGASRCHELLVTEPDPWSLLIGKTGVNRV